MMLARAAAAPRAAVLLVLVLLAVGCVIRARHLGHLGLIGDEGIQALTVQRILDTGVPRVASGVLYARSLPYLYAQAASVRLFGMSEASLRLPSVVFGVLAIWLLYLLGARVFDWRIGLGATAVLALSLWEIELSRYARFYTLFQCGYLLSLLYFYLGFIEGRRWAWWAFVPAALVTIMTHELGPVVLTVFLIPAVFRLRHPSLGRASSWWAVLAGLAAVWGLYLAFLAAHRAWGQPFPVQGPGVGAFGAALVARLVRPDLTGLAPLREATVTQAAVAWLLPAAVTGWLVIACRRDGGLRQAAQAAAIVWAAAWHQFSLAFVFALAYAAAYARPGRWVDRPLAVALGVAAAAGAYWCATLRGADDLVTVLFGYPRIYAYGVSWFLRGWPVMFAAFLLGAAWLLRQAIADRTRPEAAFVLGAVAIPVVATSAFQADFYQPRYIFHLYPLIVLICAVPVIALLRAVLRQVPRAGQGAAAAGLCLAALVASQDANPFRAFTASDRTYQAQRSAFDRLRAPLNSVALGTVHQDLQGPGRHVREHRRPDDAVVALGLPHQVAIFAVYAGGVDRSVEDEGQMKSYQLRRADGTAIEHITGNVVLESFAMLQAFLAAHPGRVWVLADRQFTEPWHPLYSDALKAWLAPLAAQPAFTGADGRTVAVLLPAPAAVAIPNATR